MCSCRLNTLGGLLLQYVIVAASIVHPSVTVSSEFGRNIINVSDYTSLDNHTSDYKYVIKKFRVPVDHFSFAGNETFEIRYLVNNTWQSGKNPPIFFYTGNEGKIEEFAANTGFMWEIAPSYGALIIFAEHRYYGESLPFGNRSAADAKHLGYLTAQQALADYVDLIEYLKSDAALKRSPVIAFGGSYGGMLSAWFRMKYPHIIQGAIAASAPILQFTGVTDCQAFNRIVTSDFRAASDVCPKVIRKSWNAINNLTSTDEGKKWLSAEWKLCQNITNSTDIKQLKDWLYNVYGNLAMVDYPYEANFLAPLPAYPINKFCQPLKDATGSDKAILSSLKSALNIYTNYTGKTRCIATEDASPNLGADLWYYQACTEMVMPMCADGINDMFEPQPWNLSNYTGECVQKYGIKPQPDLACKTYGCQELSTATNIVFSNGLLDPWSSGGVLRNLSESAIAVIIPKGAHHLDLRGSHPNDPYSVIAARNYHKFSISKWIKQYREAYVKEFNDVTVQ
ncbi:lysosomal Pro-X carboxypeptidase [Diachasma alloeum]|uniref:lysosomal Pro-X carboxypeptidase n=1 Tax=Diachasma alloeum TaxID=454923 RepID=UPI000738151D|nr:lysosomal Pro-X carboxypeptidase [Diachasma alloeum]